MKTNKTVIEIKKELISLILMHIENSDNVVNEIKRACFKNTILRIIKNYASLFFISNIIDYNYLLSNFTEKQLKTNNIYINYKSQTPIMYKKDLLICGNSYLNLINCINVNVFDTAFVEAYMCNIDYYNNSRGKIEKCFCNAYDNTKIKSFDSIINAYRSSYIVAKGSTNVNSFEDSILNLCDSSNAYIYNCSSIKCKDNVIVRLYNIMDHLNNDIINITVPFYFVCRKNIHILNLSKKHIIYNYE